MNDPSVFEIDRWASSAGHEEAPANRKPGSRPPARFQEALILATGLTALFGGLVWAFVGASIQAAGATALVFLATFCVGSHRP